MLTLKIISCSCVLLFFGSVMVHLEILVPGAVLMILGFSGVVLGPLLALMTKEDM